MVCFSDETFGPEMVAEVLVVGVQEVGAVRVLQKVVATTATNSGCATGSGGSICGTTRGVVAVVELVVVPLEVVESVVQPQEMVAAVVLVAV
jgi:hypothetical protein